MIASRRRIVAAVNRAMKTRYKIASSGARCNVGGMADGYRETLWELIEWSGGHTSPRQGLTVSELRAWEQTVKPLVSVARDNDERIANFYKLKEAATAADYTND